MLVNLWEDKKLDDEKITFYPGQIIKHFKREYASVQEQKENKHLYRVVCIAKHTETDEDLLVYTSLYYPFQTFCKPLSMCTELIDKEKYMLIRQKYRLEPWVKEETIYGIE